MFGTISFIYLERPIRRFGASIAERLAGRLSTDHPREIGALPQTAPNGAPTASGAIQPLELAKLGLMPQQVIARQGFCSLSRRRHPLMLGT
jgi:hypothetical protein